MSQSERLQDTQLGSERFVPVSSEFFERLHSDTSLQPEKRLMLAVLADAIQAFQRGVGSSCARLRRESNDAAAWFASDDDRSSPFTFVNVCFALDLDDSTIRRKLERRRLSDPRCPPPPGRVARRRAPELGTPMLRVA